MSSPPDYKKIFEDILRLKYPEKREVVQSYLEKKQLSAVDVLEINGLIFGISSNDEYSSNGKYKTYKKSDIIRILDYQKKNKLTNTQLAKHFKLSRNTVAKWKALFVLK